MPSEIESVDARCASCRQVTPHSVIKGKVVSNGRAIEGTFECDACKTVHKGLARRPVPVRVPIMVSVGARSYPAEVEVFDDDQVAVGDEFEIEEDLVEITSVELKDQARRVRRAKTQDIHTLWAKSIREITIGFSMNVGDITKSFETVFGPEDEIAVGDEFDLEDQPVVVDRILTTAGKRYRGTYNVREIKRVWLRRPRGRTTPEREDRPVRGPGSNAPRKAPGGAKRPSSRPPSKGGSRAPSKAPARGASSAPRGKAPAGGPGGARSAPRSAPRGGPRGGSRPGGSSRSRGPASKGGAARRGPPRGKTGDGKRRGPPRRR